MTPDDASAQGPATSPARTPVRWSGRKTAVGAVLAIGIAAGGGVAAAQAFPQGSLVSGGQHGFGHGGPGGPGGPGGYGMPGMPGFPGSQDSGSGQDSGQSPVPQSAPGGDASPDAVVPSRPEDDDAATASASTSDV